MKILVLSIGGTINQTTVNGRMSVSLNENEFSQFATKNIALDFCEFSNVIGANLQIKDLFRLKDKIESTKDKYDAFILLAGTDSLEEIAYGLDLIIDIQKPFIITASMRPRDALGYDGFRNFRDAIEVAHHENSVGNGILIVISENIHTARYLRKLDSQTLNAFESRTGPIGVIRRGKAHFNYLGLPETKKYPHISVNHIKDNVPIITIYLGFTLNLCDFENYDALVIAGMGTGSLPDKVIETLSKELTRKIPICITSRCLVGDNYDDFYYKGSLEKYTSKGFILKGYEGLSPYQSRLKLIFEMAEQYEP
jgi:L-asparaginase